MYILYKHTYVYIYIYEFIIYYTYIYLKKQLTGGFFGGRVGGGLRVYTNPKVGWYTLLGLRKNSKCKYNKVLKALGPLSVVLYTIVS